MLAKIAPRFVISGVIQNAYYANYMSLELTKQIIGDRGLSFSLEDPKKYFVGFFSFRNATSSATSPPYLAPQSSPVSMRLRNTTKPLRNSPNTTMSSSSSTG
jgi:hypothetical protein